MDLYKSNIDKPEFFDLEFLLLFPAIFVVSFILFLVLRYKGYLGFRFPIIFGVILMFIALVNGLYMFSLEHAIYDGVYKNKSKSVSGVVSNYRPKVSTVETFEIDQEVFEIHPNSKRKPYFSGLHNEGFNLIKNGTNLKIWFVVHLDNKFIIKIVKN